MIVPLKFKKILVAGGAGFIGNAIIKRLIQHGAEVHVIDNLSTGTNGHLPKLNSCFFYHGSVLDTSFLEKFRNIDFDLAINLASVVGMRLATKYTELTYRTCTLGAQNLIAVLKNTPILFFSSSSVYGAKQQKPVNERDTISKEDLLNFDGGRPGYACGKWDMEQIAQKESENGRKVMIIRPFNITGPFQLSDYGMVVPTLIQQAIKGDPLTVFGDGSQVRSFSCIDTFVECLFQLMNSPGLWQYRQNVVNIGCETGTSITNLAKTIKGLTKSKSNIEYIPYSNIFGSLFDVQYRVPNASYARSHCEGLNWPDLNSLIQRIYHHHINEFTS